MIDPIQQGIVNIVNHADLSPMTQVDLVATEAALAVAAAIEQACEATLARMYESVEQNEQMVRDQRKKVDDFATVLRKYYKAHVGSLGEFMAHLQRTTDELGTHVRGFEERLQAGTYPRAGEG